MCFLQMITLAPHLFFLPSSSEIASKPSEAWEDFLGHYYHREEHRKEMPRLFQWKPGTDQFML